MSITTTTTTSLLPYRGSLVVSSKLKDTQVKYTIQFTLESTKQPTTRMTSIAAASAPNIPSEKKAMPQNDLDSVVIKIPRDSLIVHIPLHVTADLGIAMKRVRAKHIARFKLLHPHLFDNSTSKTKLDATEASSLPAVEDGTKDGGDKSDAESDDDASQEKSRKDKEKDNLNMQDESMMDAIGSEVRKEQFGSMVDYLEAKYARGVMIHDLDERIREKKKNDGGKGTNDADADLNVLSDSEAGSCYSEDSGDFIDDTDLRTDVAHQILASSAFGTTRIEAEAVSKAKGADDDSIGADDHAFFVNVGDLEMEDGWNDDIEEDQDWLNSMKKSKGYVIIELLLYDTHRFIRYAQIYLNIVGIVLSNASHCSYSSFRKKRKRAPKDASSTKSASKDKKTIKKAKVDDKEKKSVDKKSVDKKSKEKQGDGQPPKKKSTKEKQGDGKPKTSSSTKEKKKKEDEHEKAKEAKSEQSPEIEEAKKDSHNLKRRVDRLYKKCVEVIDNLTKEHLPRKMKGGTGKCQIIVPEGKAPGDLLQIW